MSVGPSISGQSPGAVNSPIPPETISTEAIRTQLDRISASSGFVHSDRMVRFLRFTVDQALKGHAGELKEIVLGMEVFDRPASFDPRSDTIVRVEARRLRSKLKEYYDGEGRGDPVLIGFPKGSYFPTFVANGHGEAPGEITSSQTHLLSGKPASKQLSSDSTLTQWRLAAIIAGLVLVAVSTGITLWITRSSPRAQPLKLTRLTSDLGLTYQPALSSDGRLVAYASDRSSDGNLDIWVKQVAGGEPHRLTRHAADDHQPAFSPDGSKIAFRSDRDGGGIYLISALGGEERLIAPQGRDPQISPDGRYLACSILKSSSSLEESRIQIVALGGGPSRELQPEFTYAESPIWSPSGSHLLFLGSQDKLLFGFSTGWHRGNTFDWWVTPLEGGTPVSTGAARRFRHQGFRGRNCRPGSWDAHGGKQMITFSIQSDDTSSLWQTGISPENWQVDDLPEQLTSGTGLEVDPSTEVSGRMVFASLVSDSDIWSVPIAANRGKVLGELRTVVKSAVDDIHPSLSEDGQKLAFNSTRSGHSNVWIKDMKTGKETALTDDVLRKGRVLLNPDGSKVAFVAYDGDKVNFYLMPSTGGPLRKLCEDCGNQNLLSWSPSGTELLYYSGWPIHIGLLNIVSGKRRTVLQHPTYELHRDTLSPDERWIAFHVPLPQGNSVFIAPLAQEPAPESDWIRVTDGSGMDVWPFWSPDGGLLYFLSYRDGFLCIWVQPLDFATKKAVGLPISVLHIHSARRSLVTSRSAGGMEMSLTRDTLVFSMREITGNIWMAERQ